MNIHHLDGCAPTPLAHYLKALGILRLVAEQADAQARGWWQGDRFLLATTLDRAALELFFLESYEPTPIFNPWGGRSGFYDDSSEKSARLVLNATEQTTDSRFEKYRFSISQVRSLLSKKKPEGEEKKKLIRTIRMLARGSASLWMESVVALVGANENEGIEQPALFGTGGNEGSGSYTSAYMAAITQCLIDRQWDHAMPKAIFNDNNTPNCVWGQSMGQFAPFGDGNPWDLIFAFEGACMVRSAVTSRNMTDSSRWMASPFYVAPNSYGYPTEANLDEVVMKNGKPLPGRGEQWFPLWKQPMLSREIEQVFTEGRASAKRGRATDGWSMMRAISELGVRQGITEFIRFGYQQRNNMATHFAVPIGRVRVPEQRYPVLACLDDLDQRRWLQKVRREARDKKAPVRLQQVERRLADALFTVTQHPNEPLRWQSVLSCLTDVEGVFRTRADQKTGWIPPLRPEWVQAADDGSAEFRLALSFALQSPRDSIRRHWLPLGKERQEIVMNGRNGQDDAIALLHRRLFEGTKSEHRGLSLLAAKKAGAKAVDLARLVAGEVDLDRTLRLARALMALHRWKWREAPQSLALPSSEANAYPDDAWLAIRLTCLPFPLHPEDDHPLPVDPAMLRRLESGDAAAAVQLALRRLRSAGIRATVRVASVAPQITRLWAAALAFPIHPITARVFLDRLDPNTIKEKTA